MSGIGVERRSWERHTMMNAEENDGIWLARGGRMRTTWLILGAACVALVAPRPADACSPPPCWPAAFVPGHGGRVPANVPGLYWRPMSELDVSVKPENVVLE